MSARPDPERPPHAAGASETERAAARTGGVGLDAIAAAALSLAGIVVRLVSLHTRTGGAWARVLYPDEQNYYIDAARRLSSQGLAFFLTERSLWNGPVNPLWVWAWGNVAAARVANVLLLAVASLMVWDVARRRFGRAAGLVALLLLTAHPALATFGPTVLTEPPFIFLLTLSLWLFERADGRLPAMVGAGAAAGLACLTRPSILPWPLLLAAAVLLWRRACARRSAAGARRLTITVAFFVAGYTAVVAPWMLKNAIAFRHPAIANGFGAVFYLGSDFRTGGDEPVYSGLDFDTIRITAPYAHLDSEGDRRLVAAALARVRAHPRAYAVLCAEKAWKVLFGSPVAYFYPYRTLQAARHAPGAWNGVLEMVVTVLTVSLGILGILRLHAGADLALFVGTLIAWLTALHAVSFPIPRLALPMHLFLAVYAGGWLAGRVPALRRWPHAPSLETVLGLTAALAIVVGLSSWNVNRLWTLVSDDFPDYFRTVRDIPGKSFTASDLTRGSTPDMTEAWRACGAAPSLGAAVEPFQGERNHMVFLSLAALPDPGGRRNGLATLSWLRQDGAFTVPLPFEIAIDGQRHTYRVPAGSSQDWRGPIRALRIGFPDAARVRGFRLDRVRVGG